jgi:hypothetical protein
MLHNLARIHIHTHNIYFPRHQWSCERASVLR